MSLPLSLPWPANDAQTGDQCWRWRVFPSRWQLLLLGRPSWPKILEVIKSQPPSPHCIFAARSTIPFTNGAFLTQCTLQSPSNMWGFNHPAAVHVMLLPSLKTLVPSHNCHTKQQLAVSSTHKLCRFEWERFIARAISLHEQVYVYRVCVML